MPPAEHGWRRTLTNSRCDLRRIRTNERLLDKTSDGRFVVDRPIFTGGKGKENWARVHAIKAAICRVGKS